MLNEINSFTTTKAPVSGEQRVTVSAIDDVATIELSIYEEGLGWCTQKTITVESDMLDSLVETLSAVRGTIRRNGDEILSAEILEF
jgi:hypothetical protein